jgi:UDP-N-acetylmuramoylalanine-D-glutamate ligase
MHMALVGGDFPWAKSVGIRWGSGVLCRYFKDELDDYAGARSRRQGVGEATVICFYNRSIRTSLHSLRIGLSVLYIVSATT